MKGKVIKIPLYNKTDKVFYRLYELASTDEETSLSALITLAITCYIKTGECKNLGSLNISQCDFKNTAKNIYIPYGCDAYNWLQESMPQPYFVATKQIKAIIKQSFSTTTGEDSLISMYEAGQLYAQLYNNRLLPENNHQTYSQTEDDNISHLQSQAAVPIPKVPETEEEDEEVNPLLALFSSGGRIEL